MQVKTYRARSLKDALQMVQHELGPDARIVQTRELETGWWERFAHGRQFEIRTRRPGPQPLPLRRRRESATATTHSEPRRLTAAAKSDTFHDHVPTQQKGSEHSIETVTTATGIEQEVVVPRDASDWFDILAELIEAEVPEAAARQLLDQIRDDVQATASTDSQRRRAVVDRLAKELRVSGPIHSAAAQQRIVALIGPTGVGKTTTLAKLAANFRLREHRSVGLITIDTYRIAAVEQLRTYAEIMDLPMEVVATPREMMAAVARFADKEVVLIDTAGHSPRDDVQLQQLKSLLAEAKPDEVHLAVSAVSSPFHLSQIIDRFGPLGATALIVTKLDEATGLGTLLPMARNHSYPFSYLTCGQRVPDDILVAESASLVNVIVGQQPVTALY